jgi:hypothetical protein
MSQGPESRMTCASCGASLDADDTDCPVCGSVDRNIEVYDCGKVVDGLRVKARRGEPGEIRPHREVYDEVRWNHNRARNERRRIIADREQDYYSQEWYDLDTGELVWRKEGQLSDPKVHGESARRSKQD